jgi:hypothetical protein
MYQKKKKKKNPFNAFYLEYGLYGGLEDVVVHAANVDQYAEADLLHLRVLHCRDGLEDDTDDGGACT